MNNQNTVSSKPKNNDSKPELDFDDSEEIEINVEEEWENFEWDD